MIYTRQIFGAMLSRESLSKLATCEKRIQLLFESLAKDGWSMKILAGYRGQVEQDAAFKAGQTAVSWPNSKHNVYPSRAVDVAPVIDGRGIPYSEHCHWHVLAGAVLQKSKELDIRIKRADQSFQRKLPGHRVLFYLPHWQLED